MKAIAHGEVGRGPDLREPGALFAPGELENAWAFVLRAVRRRRRLALLVLLGFVALTAAITQALPRSYHVEARIYALPAEGAPGAVRATTEEPGGLAQGAAEVVLGQQHLLALVRSHDLIGRWDRSRVPLQRLLDRVRGAQAADPAARERNMISFLRKKLAVRARGPEVTLSFDWPEAQGAYEVVEESSQKLIAARHEAELAPLERKAAALTQAATAAQARIDAAVASVAAARKARRKGSRPASVRGLQADGLYGDLPDANLAALRLQLIASRKAIAEQEDVRRKHLSELRVLYAEQKATLGPGNPALLDTEQKLASIERQGAQLDTMKAREQQLLADYVHAGGKELELTTSEAAAWPVELREDDDAVAYGRARIAMELSGLQQLLSESVAAQATLSEVRAAFDNRYAVVAPAELPEAPASPKTLLLLLAGLVGGLFVSVVAAVSAELRGEEQEEARVPLLANVP